jgi:hypothetical protein
VTSPADLYLDLLKRTLTGMVYEDPPIAVPWLSHADYRLADREKGIDWPQHAPCMIGSRLDNVQQCVEQVLTDGVPGDLAEAGVWRGGTAIFMRALLKIHAVADRAVWVIDSFAGLPPGSGWAEAARLAVPLAEVKHNFGLYGLLDEQVHFTEGWFRDTLPVQAPGPFAVIRLDGDLYESQLDALTYLYPRLSPGGFVIIDDPQLDGCGRAIADYREKHRISEPVLETNGFTVFWRKE